MANPQLSVIIPAYNAALTLAEALDSVFAQDFPGTMEVLVVDDGSTDATREVLRGYGCRIRRLDQDNRGPQHARNRGLAAARGEKLAFLDADDRWAPGKLRRQLPRLETADLVVGYSRLLESSAPPWLFLNLGSALFQRSVFERVGPFDEALPFSDDLDWFLRAREMGVRFRVHREVVLFHRRHPGNLTRDRSRRDHFNLIALKRSLDRRRRTQAVPPASFLQFLEPLDLAPPAVETPSAPAGRRSGSGVGG